MSDTKTEAHEIAAAVMDVAANFTDPLEKALGVGIGGTVVGIVGGALRLGALFTRAFGSDAPVKLIKMHSVLAERATRDAFIKDLLHKAGVT